jgi:hypothetical protein
MKQKPFILPENISPLKMWADRYIQMIREAALEDMPQGVRDSLYKLARDIDERTKVAWIDIEHIAKQDLYQKRFGNPNQRG